MDELATPEPNLRTIVSVNRDKPDKWKADIAASVDMYNEWFVNYAPAAYRATRRDATEQVDAALQATSNLARVNAALLKEQPAVLPVLRMSTCPPLAVDRLIGLADVPSNLVKKMEHGALPRRMSDADVVCHLQRVATTLVRMIDPDLFAWLHRPKPPSKKELFRAATVVADRLCGAVASPIVRNAQEQRQLGAIGNWLDRRGYERMGGRTTLDQMRPGSYAFRMNLPARQADSGRTVNIPVDAVVMSREQRVEGMPLLLEAKSAGDFANVNKRRKEEATKNSQLRETYGDEVQLVLFLCGYFDSGYLGYEAAENIDWVWEHRIDDLSEFGL